MDILAHFPPLIGFHVRKAELSKVVSLFQKYYWNL